MLSQESWRRVMWRQGTKGPLSGTFAAKYVRLADGNENARGQHLPLEGAWVIDEQCARDENKDYLCNLPPETAFEHLIQVIKQRWACELGLRELKQKRGLDHFEGRSWQGLHHRALRGGLAVLAMAAPVPTRWLVRGVRPRDSKGDRRGYSPAIQCPSSILPVLHSIIQ
ncbi:hypothetical protein LAJ19_20955 (plasmid) [Deinococcus taeanensis]|nr:hypothetical protein [Deinococcus taeanensis]UBV45267.1 hypothetical protein LAJ19_20955 [Deinococcus taeanensis]